MRLIPLGSGSSGNATLVEIAGRRLLVDAGLSARALGLRLGQVGIDPATVDWILISHEHTDHVRGAELFSRRHGVALVCALETLEAMDRSRDDFAEWIPLPAGRKLELGPVAVDPFPVPHDAARPVGFVLEGEGVRVGLATDLGHATALVRERLRGCQALMLEANHDERMLRDGPYPWHLKQRVSGRTGHLSNDEAARLLCEVVDGESRAVVLAHLSEKNNRPELARGTAATALSAGGRRRVTVRVASRKSPTPPIEL